MQKQINELWNQIDRKTAFAEMAAEKFGKDMNSVKNHWIYNRSTPLEYQKDLVRLMKKTIKKQQRYLNSLKQ